MIDSLYEPFRKWSADGDVYILSDLHMGDEEYKSIDPKWVSPEKQIDIINSKVGEDDTFICLGDVGNPKYIPRIKSKYKILILGNNDKKSYKDYFNEMYTGPLLISNKILLSHEPIHGLQWCLNIHGHDHEMKEDYDKDCKYLNTVANLCKYTPISLGDLIDGGVLDDIDGIHKLSKKQRKLIHA